MVLRGLNKILLVSCAICMAATSAQANLVAEFREGAPKDRFTFKNVGDCNISNSKLTLDLSPSKSGLIFDVTGNGAGVEVFQPFQLVAGKTAISGKPVVRDGDTKIELQLNNLAPQQSVAFTIDVDDTKGSRAITVSNSEFDGVNVVITKNNKEYRSAFSSKPKTTITLPDC